MLHSRQRDACDLFYLLTFTYTVEKYIFYLSINQVTIHISPHNCIVSSVVNERWLMVIETHQQKIKFNDRTLGRKSECPIQYKKENSNICHTKEIHSAGITGSSGGACACACGKMPGANVSARAGHKKPPLCQRKQSLKGGVTVSAAGL